MYVGSVSIAVLSCTIGTGTAHWWLTWLYPYHSSMGYECSIIRTQLCRHVSGPLEVAICLLPEISLYQSMWRLPTCCTERSLLYKLPWLPCKQTASSMGVLKQQLHCSLWSSCLPSQMFLCTLSDESAGRLVCGLRPGWMAFLPIAAASGGGCHIISVLGDVVTVVTLVSKCSCCRCVIF